MIYSGYGYRAELTVRGPLGLGDLAATEGEEVQQLASLGRTEDFDDQPLLVRPVAEAPDGYLAMMR